MADDLPAAVRAVRDALRPGGVWIYAGPLHFYQGGGYTPKPSPTLQHLLCLAADLGLRLEAPPELVAAPYPPRPQAFLAEADWKVPFFSARLAT